MSSSELCPKNLIIHLQVSYKCRPDFQNINNFEIYRVKVHKIIIPRVCLVFDYVWGDECGMRMGKGCNKIVIMQMP